VNRKKNEGGLITAVFGSIHAASHEMKHAPQVQQAWEQKSLKRLKAFSYMRHAINNLLSYMFQSKDDHVSDNCHQQLNKILVDLD
jgi:phytochrome A